MRTSILTAFVLLAGVSYAAVTHTAIKSGVALKPGQTYIVRLDSATSVEVGWTAVQAKACTMHCVEATDLTQPVHTKIATDIGASTFYNPADGKIAIEYKNVSTDPVTINIYRVQRTCDAEACKFIDKTAKARSLVFKIKEFKSITTSKDGSYSTISGIAMSGRPFTVRAVWWTDDPNSFRFDCDKWIKRWLDNHDAPEKYSPYVLAGSGLGDDNHLVLKFVDTCVPHAPNFGATESSVFK
jgi:hypothetical protein